MIDTFKEAIDLTARALDEFDQSHWIIAFSGGKDSTAVLKIFSNAVLQVSRFSGIIDVIYCDTGVENPLLDSYVKKTLFDFSTEARSTGLPFNVKILTAPVQDRFFVKVIGRGYPPPTNSFRWCTKNLRIKPVSNFISNAAIGDAIVAIGLRRSESIQRSRSIKKAGDDYWQFQNEAGRKYKVFLPIINFDISDVWGTISSIKRPVSIDTEKLKLLYYGASGECPMLRSPTSPPCSSGRFGCWTCTVVRKDHSALKLIEAGYRELLPYLNFRNWLSQIRNDPERRWPQRRNGKHGLGPFTIAARSEILKELRRLEGMTEEHILWASEYEYIHMLWENDIQTENDLLNGKNTIAS